MDYIKPTKHNLGRAYWAVQKYNGWSTTIMGNFETGVHPFKTYKFYKNAKAKSDYENDKHPAHTYKPVLIYQGEKYKSAHTGNKHTMHKIEGRTAPIFSLEARESKTTTPEILDAFTAPSIGRDLEKAWQEFIKPENNTSGNNSGNSNTKTALEPQKNTGLIIGVIAAIIVIILIYKYA